MTESKNKQKRANYCFCRIIVICLISSQAGVAGWVHCWWWWKVEAFGEVDRKHKLVCLFSMCTHTDIYLLMIYINCSLYQ